jgi:antitoxin component YwqK of YwqJK toxin-antitoxin module
MYADGARGYERVYKAGRIESSTAWYPDGTVLSESGPDGDTVTTRGYGPDGKLDSEVSYLGDAKHGHQRMWWDNGNLQEERQYHHGQPIGVWRRWDRNGKLIEEDDDPKLGFPSKK